MAAVAGIAPLAHGGLAGAIAESLIAIAIAGVLVAVWIRERRGGKASDGPAALRDEEDA